MEARRILIIESSPRKGGNSILLAGRLAEGAREPGAGGCVLPDGMQGIYAAIRGAEAIVLASPIYFFSLNAQMKAAIDRLYAFGAARYVELKDKRFAGLFAFGDRDAYESGCMNAVRAVEDLCRYLGAPRPEFVYGSADAAGEVAANAELLERAYKLGKRLAIE
jgi:multimeric flavodoxin WrbA